MKILVFDTDMWVNLDYLSYLEDQGHELIIEKEKNYQHGKIEAIIVYRTLVTSELLDQFPKIKVVMRVGVGLDKIDLDECKKRDIRVHNTPGANADSVADLAIRGTLTCKRHAIPAYEIVKNHVEHTRFPHEGDELAACSVGFVGFGNIGRKICTRLLSFGTKNLMAYDPYLKVSPFSEVILFTERDVLLAQSDIIYVVLPLTAETKHLINQNFLANCKPTACIINTSRGGITQEQDLYEFLSQNPKSSYYGDVREGEPIITDSIKKLIALENCILTPHIGAHTIQAQKRMHSFELD